MSVTDKRTSSAMQQSLPLSAQRGWPIHQAQIVSVECCCVCHAFTAHSHWKHAPGPHQTEPPAPYLSVVQWLLQGWGLQTRDAH